MKKVIIGLLFVGIVVGAYFGYEFTIKDPEVKIELEAGYDSIHATYSIVDEKIDIDFENSTFEFYTEEGTLETLPLETSTGELDFQGLEFNQMYNLKLNLAYKNKFYFTNKEIKSEVKLGTAFDSEKIATDTKEGNPIPYDFFELSDGNMLVVSGQYNQGKFSAFVSKYSKEGQLIWDHLFESDGIVSITGAKEMEDGTIKVNGKEYGNGKSLIHITTFNQEGQIISKSTDTQWFGTNSYYFNSSLELVYDEDSTAFTIEKNNKFYFVKLDQNDRQVVNKELFSRVKIDKWLVGVNHQLYKYKEGYLLATQDVVSMRRRDAKLMYLDTDGSIIWEKSFENEGDAKITDLVIDGDNIVFATEIWYAHDDVKAIEGRTRFDTALYRVDGKGSLIWCTNFEESDWDRFSDIEIDNNGDYLIAGVSAKAGFRYGYLWKVRQDGSMNSMSRVSEGRALELIVDGNNLFISSVEHDDLSIHKHH